MFFHTKQFAVPFLWFVCAVALPVMPAVAAPSPVRLSALKAQLSSLSTTESKLEFLKTALSGQSLEAKATIGAALIQSTPADAQKEVAGQVAQILAGLKDGPSDTAKLAGMLTAKLPRNLAGLLAGRIAIGAGTSDPQHLPQITAAVITAQSSTVAQAGAIAEEIIASAPLARASSIASAIGAAFIDNPTLANKAPQIAAGITRAILSHQGTVEQLRPELANSIAALTVLLPGSISSNKDLITNIGKEVAAVIAAKNSGMATTIVGITSAALKSAAGSSDIAPVLNSFRDAFKSSINDPIIQDKLDRVVSEVNQGASDKVVTPLEKAPATVPPGLNGPSYAGGYGGGGVIVLPETNVVNH